MRRFLWAAAFGVSLASAGEASAISNGELISETMAERYGLVRPWVTQVELDRGRARVSDVVLYQRTLYVQTDRAVIEAIDAETGQRYWTKQIGRPDHPSMTPAVCRDMLATINGSRLYVLNRYNGEIIYQTTVDGAPGAGPGLSTKRAYVPMVTGMIRAYRLEPLVDAMKDLGKVRQKDLTEEEKKAEEEERRQNIRIRQDYIPPMACQSSGRALVQPVVTSQNSDEEFCAWATDRGFLHLGRIDRRSEDNLTVRFRLQTGQAIMAPPAWLPPDPKVVGDSGIVYCGSNDGYVYALVEKTGELLWKFSAAEPVVDSPAAFEDRVFATTQMGGLYCLDAKSGKQLWYTADIMHFVAAGKQRIYAADKLGRLQILDGKTGSLIDSMPTTMLPIKLQNNQTDRIYLGTEGGLLQCLHELEAAKPIEYLANRQLPPDELPKLGAHRAKPGEGGDVAAKRPAASRPVAKKSPPKKADDAFGGAAGGADEMPKATKKAASPTTKKGVKGAKSPDAADPFGGPAAGGAPDDPFGGNGK